MSRSYKKNPFTGITCTTSEKKDKRIANRRFRRRCDQALIRGEEMPLENEVSNIWDFSKDGKFRYEKSSEWYKKVIRK